MRKAFTLVELLVVVAMIALIMGAVSTSMSSAMQRARVQKATAEVKALTQAVLAYENYSSDHTLPENDFPYPNGGETTASKLQFLLGDQSVNGERVPVLIQAALTSQGVMRDPWGMPYYIMIKSGKINLGTDSLKTGYYLPNFYRLTEEDRK